MQIACGRKRIGALEKILFNGTIRTGKYKKAGNFENSRKKMQDK